MIIVDQLLTHSSITTISRLVRLTEQTINPIRVRVRMRWPRDGGSKSKNLMRFVGEILLIVILQKFKVLFHQFFMEKGITDSTENT